MIISATEQHVVGQALAVEGTVKVESANGMSRVIEPNSPLFFNDHVDTGASGSVSIVFNDDGSQLNLVKMSTTVIDDDVLGTDLPDLEDVAAELGLVSDLLLSWDELEPVAPLATLVPGTDDVSAEDLADTGDVPTLDSAPETLSATDEGGDGIDSLDDDFDMTDLMPPPEDIG